MDFRALSELKIQGNIHPSCFCCLLRFERRDIPLRGGQKHLAKCSVSYSLSCVHDVVMAPFVHLPNLKLEGIIIHDSRRYPVSFVSRVVLYVLFKYSLWLNSPSKTLCPPFVYFLPWPEARASWDGTCGVVHRLLASLGSKQLKLARSWNDALFVPLAAKFTRLVFKQLWS